MMKAAIYNGKRNILLGELETPNPALMNGITGACVCIMTLAIGIYMICSAGRQRKRIQEEMQEGL